MQNAAANARKSQTDSCGLGDQRGQLERPRDHAQRCDRHQHEQRPDERVDDELDRRGAPPRPAPYAHEHVERDHHDLPADVEQHQVLRGEEQDERELEHEEQREVGARPLAAQPDRGARGGGDPEGRRSTMKSERPSIETW